MNRRDLLRSAGASVALTAGGIAQTTAAAPPLADDRAFWLQQMHRVAYPVLSALSQQKLKATMPVEAVSGHQPDRRLVTHLEAFARTLSGIAPWLENGPSTGPEGSLRAEMTTLAQTALAHAVDKTSPDYLGFGEQQQTVVDAGFLALALARAPKKLVATLTAPVRTQLADALRATRVRLAPYNNWLLFAAMVEAALFQLGEPWDRTRVDYALREHERWFLGDGVYGDGPHFHADYYNSFVIHPFLLALTGMLAAQEPAWTAMVPAIHARAQRYATIQERLIAPDGTFPIVGRSIAYRCGAFHLLADVALRQSLSPGLPPQQVRCALTAVLRRTLEPAATFDPAGWLRIGLAGHQPSLAEPYISTGSLYLCATAFLPLALRPQDVFWSGASTPWTSKRLWQGEDLPADHAQDS